MKKILYIKSGGKAVTGGIKVNNQIYEKLKEIKNVEVDVKDDSFFWKNQLDILNKLPTFMKSIIFNFKYLKKKEMFQMYDYIFVDSRLYPRLFIFISILKKNNDIKIMTTHHHFCYLQQQNIIKKTIHKILELNFLNNTNKIFTFSNYTFNTAKINGIDIEKLTLDELGFDKKKVDNQFMERANNNLLFIGTVEPRKGLKYLIRAFANIKREHNDLKIHIVGEYDPNSKYYKELVELIRKHKITKNIKFHGRISDEDIIALKIKSSFFVFPSLYEGFGMAMAEGMVYGLPVIAFNNSAMPYLVKDNYNGLIVQNKDVIDLSIKIKILLNNQNLRDRLSEGAIQTANNLNNTSEFLSSVKYTMTSYIYDNNDRLMKEKEKK